MKLKSTRAYRAHTQGSVAAVLTAICENATYFGATLLTPCILTANHVGVASRGVNAAKSSGGSGLKVSVVLEMYERPACCYARPVPDAGMLNGEYEGDERTGL